MQIFTGVGSRETPKEILDIMRKVSKKLILNGYTLRSGGADGADTAFYEGWWDAYKGNILVPKAEIYLPWSGFNNHIQGANYLVVKDSHILSEATQIASEIHPAFQNLGHGAKALHTRNCFQVLGSRLDEPSNFLVCYAKRDKKSEPSGGTRTAIKLAEKYGIKVTNLFVQEDLDRVVEYLNR